VKLTSKQVELDKRFKAFRVKFYGDKKHVTIADFYAARAAFIVTLTKKEKSLIPNPT